MAETEGERRTALRGAYREHPVYRENGQRQTQDMGGWPKELIRRTATRSSTEKARDLASLPQNEGKISALEQKETSF